MDTVALMSDQDVIAARYREIIIRLFQAYDSRGVSNPGLRQVVIYDTVHDRYLLVVVGWKGKERVYSTIGHVEMIDGKVWVERDESYPTILDDLLEAGIPREAIVIGFAPPGDRGAGGFAEG